MAQVWTKIVPATAVILAAVAWWGHREPAAAPITRQLPAALHSETPLPQPPQNLHSSEELRREVQALKGKLDQLAVNHSEPEARLPPRGPTFDIDGAHEADKATFISLNETLEREAVDPKWRTEMDDRVRGFFATAGRGSSLVSLDCRTTLCRANVQLEDVEAKASFTRRVSELLQKGAEGYAYMDSPEDLTLEVFLTKEGHRLPSS